MHPEKSRSRPVTKSKAENAMANDLLAAVSRHKGLIVLGTALGLLLSVLYMAFLPPSYESSATILLMQNDSGTMAAEMSSKNTALSEDLLATHIGIIQSRSIVSKALERFADENALSVTPVAEEAIDIEGVQETDELNSDDVGVVKAAVITGEIDVVAIEEPAPTANDSVIGSSSLAALDTLSDGSSAASEPVVDELEAPKRLMLSELPSIVEALDDGQSPVAYILENMYTVRGGEEATSDSQLLTVSFEHSNPEDAQKIVAAVVREYQDFIDSKFKDINLQAVALIVKAREDLEASIEDLSKEYGQFRANAPLLASTSGGANIYASRYEDLASELSTVLVKIDERISRLQIVKDGLAKLAGPGRSLEKLALIDDQNAQRLGVLVSVEGGEAESAAFQSLQPQRMAEATTEYSSLLVLRSQLKVAISERGPNHPEVKALASQVEDTEKFLAARSSGLAIEDHIEPVTADGIMVAYTSLLENDLADLQRRKTDLEARMLTAEQEAKNLIAFEIEDEGLVRKMGRAEELYNSVVERLRDINMQKDSAPLIHEVIAEPLVGELTSPTLPIAVAIGLLGMVFFSGSGILIAELNDKSVHSAAELADLYGTEIVAHLPDFNSNPASRKVLRAAKQSGSNVDPCILALHAPGSPTSESFKALRTQLLFTLGGVHRSVAFTSARQGDGKSTSIANLAVSIAQAGRKVLLVDCDLRRPRQHSLFGLENQPGLANLLTDSDEIQDCIQSTPIAMLSVMACGELPPNPAELLSSQKFESLLETLRETYDYVLLDCPPLMPVSDAAIIASIVDGVMVVNQIGPRSKVDSTTCKKTLDSVGARLLGLIVNRVEESFGGYMVGNYGFGNSDYKYGYNYSSEYGKSTAKRNGTASSESVLERK